MKTNKEIFKEILVGGHYVTEHDFDVAVKNELDGGVPVLEYFLSEGLLTKDIFGQAMAEYYKIPYIDLSNKELTPEQVMRIPEDFAKYARVIFINEKGKNVTIATDTPDTKKLTSDLTKIFPGKKFIFNYALSEDIDEALRFFNKELDTRFDELFASKTSSAPKIIEEVINEALSRKASDIHFEPLTETVVIRFRIDGVLSRIATFPKENYENILNRIKVNARLRIDEHVSAQDGAMRFAGEGGVVTDIRVSIVPTIEGEKIALRILSHYIENLTLSDLGLGEASEKKIKDAADKPFGMILVVGPTGAGKTTTLYAVLKRLNQPDVNITTIEDPVEYRMQGVNQIQVNADTHLTFAEGLRSIVRQDPDIILVGEIRDKETAEISVNAALTGHLLLSTFHANDASSALPRLVEMDIEPFLLASTLEVVVAQRLARRLCQNCRYSTSVARTSIEKEFPFLKKYWKGNKVTLYKSRGCKACGNTGYTGRVGIFEFISITPAMEELILKHPNAAEIRALAKKEGTVFMFEDGMDKVKNGITTIEEVVRVVGMPE